MERSKKTKHGQKKKPVDHKSEKSEKSEKSDNEDKPKGKGKGNQRKQPCRFFKSGIGCKMGAECAFKHGALKHTDGQCFKCGAKGRAKPECPYPKKSKGNRRGLLARHRRPVLQPSHHSQRRR